MGEVLLGGALTVFGILIGALLQPWIQRQIRRDDEKTKEEKEWRERGRELVAELDTVLSGLGFDFTHEAASAAADRWIREFERPLVMMSRFYPDETVRTTAARARLEFRRAVNLTALLRRLPEGDQRRITRDADRKVALGEAAYAVDELIGLLGGPPPPDRASYPLPLRTDVPAREHEIWASP